MRVLRYVALTLAPVLMFFVLCAKSAPKVSKRQRGDVVELRETFYLSRKCPGSMGWFIEDLDNAHSQATFVCEYVEGEE